MITKKDAAFLKNFLTWSHYFEVTPHGQMLISYRKKPSACAFCGVEGWLQNKTGVPAGLYRSKYARLLKLEEVDASVTDASWDHEAFHEFNSSKKLAQFEMSGKYISLCSKFPSGVVFRFQQVDDQDLVLESRLHELVANQKPLFASANPEAHIDMWFWRKLPKKDFWVTVLENGFFLFEQTDGNFIIYLKTRMVQMEETPLGP
jgi:hypothetical protein